MSKWLVKTEPESYSIDQFAKDKVTCWDGVRNYQARNYLRSMKVGDEVLLYYSNADPTGVIGIAKVVKEAYPEKSQFDPQSDYFDEKSSKDNPRWFSPDLKLVKSFDAVIPLEKLRKEKSLGEMVVLKRGNRLSVTPVTAGEFSAVLKLADD